MKTSLTINATRAGKKVAKSFGYVNPDVANSLVGGFAQMVNALSNDTFVNAEVVKKMDTTEEDTGGGSAPATGKTIPTLSISTYPEINLTSQDGVNYSYQYDAAYGDVTFTVEYNGDGAIYAFAVILEGLDAVQNPIGSAAVRIPINHNSNYQFSFDAETLAQAESIVIVTTETANFAPKVLVLSKEE